MTEGKPNRYWLIAAVILLVAIVAGGLVAWSRYQPANVVEISLPAGEELRGQVYVGGAVASPGFYPLADSDTIESLVSAAGGVTGNASASTIKLYISLTGVEPAQKVDINRADAWLLAALPGIGDTLAQRIVDYRRQNGLFRNTSELLKVSGIGTANLERIRDLITVVE